MGCIVWAKNIAAGAVEKIEAHAPFIRLGILGMAVSSNDVSFVRNEEDMTWRRVPSVFTNGVEDVYATRTGRIRIRSTEVVASVGCKGRSGHYAILSLNNRSAYVHRLVYYAHSTLPLETLQCGRVLFKEGAPVRPDGVYRNHFEDLLFEAFVPCEDCGSFSRPVTPVTTEDTEDGEEWRPVPLNAFTELHYLISSKGRLKKHGGITTGWPVRTYRQVELCVSSTAKKKYYIHKLVYMAFRPAAATTLSEGARISHLPGTPILHDGTLRNYSSDVCETTHASSALQAHRDKRARMASADTVEKIDITDLEDA